MLPIKNIAAMDLSDVKNCPSTSGVNSELDEIIKLMWGTQVKEDVFQRWTQGNEFNKNLFFNCVS